MSADFELEVQHVTARSFVRGLQTGDVRAHDLDKAVPQEELKLPEPRAPLLTEDDLLWLVTGTDTGPSTRDLTRDGTTTLRGAATPIGGLTVMSYDEWTCFFAPPYDELWVDLVERKKNSTAATATSPLLPQTGGDEEAPEDWVHPNMLTLAGVAFTGLSSDEGK